MNARRKIRFGMVGGSLEAFIGNVHRMAANLDGELELVCGIFSSDRQKSVQTGQHLGLSQDRVYKSIEELISKEKALPRDERMQFLSIVTPNHLHFPPAKLAIENGFHVMCEKPMTFNSQEAVELSKLVPSNNVLFGLMHTYTGYPMVKEAKNLIHSGGIGKITKVLTEYTQGWLTEKIEDSGQKQASWRTDPNKAGASSAVGDIGTHVENIIEYTTGKKLTAVSARLNQVVQGRELDDDGTIYIEMEDGITGSIIVSQVAAGEENELKIRIYGDQGGIEWLQSNPNRLIVKHLHEPSKILTAGSPWLSDHAKAHCRLPAGHPEGYIEAKANIYRNFALAIRNKDLGLEQDPIYDYPSIDEGVRGMKFIEAVVHSNNNNSQLINTIYNENN